MTTRNKSRLILMLLAIMFAIPPLLAAWMYSHYKADLSAQAQAEGALMRTQIILPWRYRAPASPTVFNLQQDTRQWALIYVNPTPQLSTQALYQLRQIRLALAQGAYAVTRVIVLPHPPSASMLKQAATAYPGTIFELDATHQLAKAFKTQPVLLNTLLQTGGYLISDPAGQVVLYYPADMPMKAIHKDLTHLLKLAKMM